MGTCRRHASASASTRGHAAISHAQSAYLPAVLAPSHHHPRGRIEVRALVGFWVRVCSGRNSLSLESTATAVLSRGSQLRTALEKEDADSATVRAPPLSRASAPRHRRVVFDMLYMLRPSWTVVTERAGGSYAAFAGAEERLSASVR